MKERLLRFLKWFCIFSLKVFAGLFLFLLLLEFSFRWQIFDFYKTELQGLNSASDLEKTGKKKPSILVFGDSFSASQGSWVDVLRKKFPGYRIINAAIPGTGIIQASYIAKKRFNLVNPDIVIYQFYTGNDLFDIRFPARGNISIARKLYWFLSNRFRSLGWINYKAGQWKSRGKNIDTKLIETDFSPGNYSEREKTMFQAEPKILSNQVLLKNGREKDFEIWVACFMELYSWFQSGIDKKFHLLVIPQAAQINFESKENVKKAGAIIEDQELFSSPSYPLLDSMKKRVPATVNILSPFRWMKDSSFLKKIFYDHDPHLTPEGQDMLGNWMADQIFPETKSSIALPE